MLDFAQPIDPLAQGQAAFSPSAVSINRQQKQSLTDNAVEAVTAASGKALTFSQRKALEELQLQRDVLKRTLEKLEKGGKALTQEEIQREFSERNAKRGEKDRARIQGDENRTLGADDIALSKQNAEILSGQERAAIAQRQQASGAEYNAPTQTKLDLPPPYSSAAKEQKETKTDIPTFLEKKFDALSKGPARERKVDIANQIDDTQQEQRVLQTIRTDQQATFSDPEVSTNPRTVTSQELRRENLNDSARFNTMGRADLRRLDIIGQTYDNAQRDLGKVDLKLSTNAQSAEIAKDSNKDIFSTHEQRQTERQSKVTDNEAKERIEQTNTRSHARAFDQISEKIADTNNLLRKQTQLEQIKKTNPEGDFGYPAENTPDAIAAREQDAKISGGDANNAPERLVTKPAEKADKVARENEPQQAAKTVDNTPISIQLKKLETNDTQNPTNQQDSPTTPIDKEKEFKVLAQRTDLTGIKAQGRELILARKQLDEQKAMENGENAQQEERLAFINQQQISNDASIRNQQARAKNDALGIENRDTRLNVLNEGAKRRDDVRSELKPVEQQAITDNVRQKQTIRETNSLDFTQLQQSKQQIDSRAVEKRVENITVEDNLTVKDEDFVEAVADENVLETANNAQSENFVITVVEPAKQLSEQNALQSNATDKTERFEYATSGRNSAGISTNVQVIGADAPLPGTAAADNDPRSAENIREEIAKTIPDGSSNLGDAASQQDAKRVAGL